MKLDETQVIRFPQLHRKIGLSRSTIFRLEKAGTFPRHLQLGAKSVGWLLVEVDNWISQRTKGGE